jgi:leucyl-tRNA synthetase
MTRKEITELDLVDHHRFYWDRYLNGEQAYTEKGILVNSGQFSGLTSDEAIIKMQERLEEKQI